MARELLISSYLFVFRALFTLFNCFPQKNKTVFVASFGDNVDYVRSACLESTHHKLIILKASGCRYSFESSERELVLIFNPLNITHFLRSIYHLATAKVIFIDNYFGFLAATRFKRNVACVQLWHAAGAVKKFGLMDPTIKQRSKRALQRFQRVYNTFTHVVVGSDKMAEIFQASFGLTKGEIVRTGIPRTDFFFRKKQIQIASQKILNRYPMLNEKKVLLYAPTFRDAELGKASLHLDIDHLYQQLGDDYILVLKLHPAVQSWDKIDHDHFVVNASDYPDINELLTVTDILITDYSSIPYEFALLGRPMIFYSYDLEAYRKERGFWDDYQSTMPGPIVQTTAQLANCIINHSFDLKRVRVFSEMWNQYSNGNASHKIIELLYGQE